MSPWSSGERSDRPLPRHPDPARGAGRGLGATAVCAQRPFSRHPDPARGAGEGSRGDTSGSPRPFVAALLRVTAFWLLAGFVLLTAQAATGATSPSYLVERLVSRGGAVQRVSVFRDGVAVLSRPQDGGGRELLERQLNQTERRVILQVVDECYTGLRKAASAAEAVGEPWVEIRVAPLGRDEVRLRLPLLEVKELAVGRLIQALDDLEQMLASQRGPHEDLTGWTPARGEVVELLDGRTVRVRDVLQGSDGTVVQLEVVGSPVSMFWSLADLREKATRRVAP
jgi:hypothetical protein